MSDEISQQRQCQTCSVYFLTSDQLRDHLDEYRSQETLLSAKLEQCRAHSSPLDDEYDTSYDTHDHDNSNVDGDVYDIYLRRNDKPTDQFYCPHEECTNRDKPFPNRPKLLRHFGTHVRCIEVCVYCFELFTQASQYITHTQAHKGADMTKNSYIRQICHRLKQDVAKSVDDFQLKAIEAKKRTREELAGTSDARTVKAKLDVDDAITSSSPLHFPSFIGVNSLPSDEASLQPVPASVLHPNSVGVSARVPTERLDERSSAPTFWATTYPSNHAAEQFHGEIGGIQTRIRDPSSNLRVGEYSTMPQGVQEGYMFRNSHNGAEQYHRQS